MFYFVGLLFVATRDGSSRFSQFDLVLLSFNFLELICEKKPRRSYDFPEYEPKMRFFVCLFVCLFVFFWSRHVSGFTRTLRDGAALGEPSLFPFECVCVCVCVGVCVCV